MTFSSSGVQEEAGFTLAETIISFVVGGLLLSVLSAVVTAFIWLPPRANDKLAAVHDLEQATLWITRDGNIARTFSPLASPQYGRFQWEDYTTPSMQTYTVTYYYDSGVLVREESRDGQVLATNPVARYIASASDVSFTWSPSTYSLLAAITSTVPAESTIETTTLTTTATAALRPRRESPVSPPGDVPVPPPPPGSESYYVAGEPQILTGTLVSGNGASLHDIDSNYYVVAGATAGPGVRLVSYVITSQNMTAPPSISSLQISFTGQADRTGVVMELFVKNSAAGFPSTADSGFTFTASGTDVTNNFFPDAATVAYINSSRIVVMKVQATTSATFNLSTNQITFIASP